jgi:hypothetical protein
MNIKSLAAVMLLLAASSALASQNDVASIVAQQSQIRAEAQADTGRYKDMPENTRRLLISRQDKVLRELAGKQSLDELGPVKKTALLNDLEWIHSVVSGSEDDRMVCEYQKTIGSNRKTRVCKTVAQKRKEQEDARKMLGRAARCAQGDIGCVQDSM